MGSLIIGAPQRLPIGGPCRRSLHQFMGLLDMLCLAEGSRGCLDLSRLSLKGHYAHMEVVVKQNWFLENFRSRTFRISAGFWRSWRV